MSARSRERFGAAAMRRNAASARARRTGSSARQERNAVAETRGDLRVLRIEREHDVGEEIVSRRRPAG